MELAKRISRFFHTVRYLQPVQIYGRIWFRLHKPKIAQAAAPALRVLSGQWAKPAIRPASFDGSHAFTFLNLTHDLNLIGWDNTALAKLWRYNLHYFDDLNALGAPQRADAHAALIDRWIAENPAGQGTGWEPYPNTLRMVNWIKWALNGTAISPRFLHSLALQARWQTQRMEYHLPANHLFSNAKALIFAGIYFTGAEADRWRALGCKIVRQQIGRQVLEDGGQFELSPMYHALALEDVLDLINILNDYQPNSDDPAFGLSDQLRPVAQKMLHWLVAMSHPDGDISFFNDSAFGIAPSNSVLFDYAQRLGFRIPGTPVKSITRMVPSGYIRMTQDHAVAILDVGEIGPQFLPGHAHADTLSFELSVRGQRVIVNSGTSEYGISAERQRQRGTAAHSTIEVNDTNSSNVWGGFRTAERAHPRNLLIAEDGPALSAECAHDGYSRLVGVGLHLRQWQMEPHRLIVRDRIEGTNAHAIAHFHFHPHVKATQIAEYEFELRAGNSEPILCSFSRAARIRVIDGTWHPEFGKSITNTHMQVTFSGAELTTRIEWT